MTVFTEAALVVRNLVPIGGTKESKHGDDDVGRRHHLEGNRSGKERKRETKL